MPADHSRRQRTSYHHGDLRKTLIAAGLDMAREGGPDAVVLREATRRAGVAPNASYRHFADRQALLRAVSDASLALAADRIERELNGACTGSTGPDNSGANSTGADNVLSGPGSDEAVSTARKRLRAIGRGYIAFAREEPGLFRTAFSIPDDLKRAADPAKAGTGGKTAFQLVGMVLDELVAAGVFPAARRPGAEFQAWSAVHGLGMLVIDGPLRGLTDDMVREATERLLDMVDRGL